MKKRQELATQMQIEAVKDAREQICGSNIDGTQHWITGYNQEGSMIVNTSFEIYFKFDGYTPGNGFPILTNSGGSIGFRLQKSTTRLLCWIGGISSHITKGSKYGDLIHLIASFDNNGDCSIYYDGVFLQKAIQGTLYSTSYLYIGTLITGTEGGIGNIILYREYNYSLSADEVTALYNNGKPEEYALLKKMRKHQGIISYGAFISNNYVQSTKIDDGYIFKAVGKQTDEIQRPHIQTSLRVNGEVFNDIGTKFRTTFKAKKIGGELNTLRVMAFNSSYDVELSDTLTEYSYESHLRSIHSNNGAIYIYLFGEDKEIMITDINVEFIGCIAEYLPQNLISTNDGVMNSTTATKWLDSAKQLPLNDEYLEPLLESIGGYDLTASGEPEIVYKPNVVQFWDLLGKMDVEKGASDLNTIATMDAITNGARLNYTSGGSMQYPRLRYPSIEDYNAIGKRIKVEYDYNVIYGHPIIDRIETIGVISAEWTNLKDTFIDSGHKEHISTNLGRDTNNTLRLDFGNSDEPYSIEITNVRVSYWNE